MDLSTPIEQIPRIGPVYQRKLKKLGVKTVRDILFHFPHRYEDFSNLIPIAEVKTDETSCILGKILDIKTTRIWKRKLSVTEAIIEDKTGAIKATWFNQPYLEKVLKPSDIACFAGKVLTGKKGIHLSNPIYEKILKSELHQSSESKLPAIYKDEFTHTARIIPVYPETERLSSRWLRTIIKPLLLAFKSSLDDPLPEKIRKENQFLSLAQALWQVHFPDNLESAEKAKSRFSFEELFNISLFTGRARMRIALNKAPVAPFNIQAVQKLVNSLPYKLTDPQRKSAWQILKDMEKPRPMNRLLEGDVGSGKTVVAAIAALNMIKAGYQIAFMAPTEILAKQHFRTVAVLLQNFKINIGLLTGKEDKFISWKLKNDTVEISRKKLLERTMKEEINILIGTHALIQKQVKFGNLGLVILDEQHRFGVEQRARLQKNSLKQIKSIPHLLSMTATPIPRTLALTIYGDLDLSLIDELPKGRKKIITKAISPEGRKKAYAFLKKHVKLGRQVFVICPRIESGKTSENKPDALGWAEAKAVKEEYEKLSKQIFPDLKIGMLHGKMALKEKERIMRDFKNGKINILVSTSVIEVGIDIPNATVMMIEGAERFGLAQLHQFRGRVGRSKYQSYCLLFSESDTIKTARRLKALVESEDGFELAEKDLEIRGPGDFQGTRQWGIPDLVMNSLKDIRLIEKTRQAAKEILEDDPYLKKYPLLKERIEEFGEKIHLE
ncbi:MAG: ATP-dependent DNA helicase RecG [Candidatus Parcubacteria bacterium]|nr:ATP-dependent DNA helicase RecG [Candidatus Parcubacteria bacterium]